MTRTRRTKIIKTTRKGYRRDEDKERKKENELNENEEYRKQNKIKRKPGERGTRYKETKQEIKTPKEKRDT